MSFCGSHTATPPHCQRPFWEAAFPTKRGRLPEFGQGGSQKSAPSLPIVAFDQSWKNVVATFYHELNEARTVAGVEDNAVAWVNDESPSEEIGDIPMTLAGADLSLVMKEVELADGSGKVPIQLMWSNAVHAPEGPIDAPHKH